MCILLVCAGAALAQSPSAAPSPITTVSSVKPDKSDVAALDAYMRDKKNADVLFDYFFSLLHLERYPDARRVLGEWRAAAPADPRHGDVGPLLGALEKEPDARKREQIGTDWAMAQRKAARAQMEQIRVNMQKMGEGLKDMDEEQHRRGAEALPRLKAQVETTPTADNWVAYSDALVATDDYPGALKAAKEAARLDGKHVLAAISVTILSRFDGKNGDDVKKALQKERINQIIKKVGP